MKSTMITLSLVCVMLIFSCTGEALADGIDGVKIELNGPRKAVKAEKDASLGFYVSVYNKTSPRKELNLLANPYREPSVVFEIKGGGVRTEPAAEKADTVEINWPWGRQLRRRDSFGTMLEEVQGAGSPDGKKTLRYVFRITDGEGVKILPPGKYKIRIKATVDKTACYSDWKNLEITAGEKLVTEAAEAGKLIARRKKQLENGVVEVKLKSDKRLYEYKNDKEIVFTITVRNITDEDVIVMGNLAGKQTPGVYFSILGDLCRYIGYGLRGPTKPQPIVLKPGKSIERVMKAEVAESAMSKGNGMIELEWYYSFFDDQASRGWRSGSYELFCDVKIKGAPSARSNIIKINVKGPGVNPVMTRDEWIKRETKRRK